MPFIKRRVSDALFTKRRQVGDLVEATQQFERVCFLLATLVRHADDLFGELFEECRQINGRIQRINERLSSGLTETVFKLNAREAHRRRRLALDDISSLPDDDEPFQTRFGYDCQLFSRSTRPVSVEQLYNSSDVNPLTIIGRGADGDELIGTKIFSPCLVTEWHVDDSAVDCICTSAVPASGCLRSPVDRHRSPRPPRESDNSSASVDEDLSDLPELPCVSVVPIVVTVAGFTRQTKINESLSWVLPPDSCQSTRVRSHSEPCEWFTWRSAPGIQSSAVERRRSVSETRSSSRRVQSGFLDKYAPSVPIQHGRTTLRQLKRKPKSFAGDDSHLCSWRYSLCVGLGMAKENGEDLWAEQRPQSLAVHSRTTSDMQMRSQSLPRTFRGSFIGPLRRLMSTRYSISQAVSPPRNNKSRRRETLPDTLFHGADNAGTSGSKLCRSRSLERPAHRQAASSNVANIVRPKDHADEDSVQRRSREVYIELPDKPWTKPFATVKLRCHSNDTYEYQSSSGHWSGDSGCAYHSANVDSISSAFISQTESHCNDKDSAVSLAVNFDSRSPVDVSSLQESTNTAGSHVDDQLSLYSIDQDGFFTSMHADSGLPAGRKYSTETLVPDKNDEPLAFDDLKTDSNNEDTLSYQLSDSSSLDSSHPLSSSSSTTLAGVTKCGEAASGQPYHISELVQDDSCMLTTVIGDDVDCAVRSSRSKLNAMATYPSFCTITPPSSDGEVEDADLMGWTNEWRSQKSPSITFSTPVGSYSEKLSSAGDSQSTLTEDKSPCGQADMLETNKKYSTWPCSPVFQSESGSAKRGILKSSGSSSNCVQSKAIKFRFDETDSVKNKLNDCCNSSSSVFECVHAADATVRDEQNSTIDSQTSANGPELVIAVSPATGEMETKMLPGHSNVNPGVSESITDPEVLADESKCVTGVRAALVISAPIKMQTAYIENYHRRLVCHPVSCVELSQFAGYTNPANWCSTLPRAHAPKHPSVNRSKTMNCSRAAETGNQHGKIAGRKLGKKMKHVNIGSREGRTSEQLADLNSNCPVVETELYQNSCLHAPVISDQHSVKKTSNVVGKKKRSGHLTTAKMCLPADGAADEMGIISNNWRGDSDTSVGAVYHGDCRPLVCQRMRSPVSNKTAGNRLELITSCSSSGVGSSLSDSPLVSPGYEINPEQTGNFHVKTVTPNNDILMDSSNVQCRNRNSVSELQSKQTAV